LPQLAAAKPGESLASALVVISNGNPSMRDRVLRDAASDPSTLDATLAATLEAGGHAPADLLVSLLKSDNQDLRMITAWHLARVVANGDAAALTPEINAVLDPLFASNASRVTWEALGLELLARAAHQKKHERHWTELKEDSAGEMARWRPGADGKLLALMSDDERDDLTDALYGKRDLWRRSSRLAPTFGGPVIGPPATEQPKDLGVRTVPPFTKGLWQDVLSLEQCDAKPRRMVVAEVAYFPDGRIQRLYVGKTDAGDACVRAAQVLLRLTMSFGAKPASKEDVLVLPLVPEHIACADDEPAWGVEGEVPARIGRIHGQTVPQPKKIQDLKPVYPEAAQMQRLQGPVLMDAVISRTGCVANATVKSSPAPMLSGAALFAVMGWRYTPTLIDDKPVPVMMTVTVNFTLSP
jgi:TonB family protein